MQSRLVCLSVVLIVLATVGGASAGILESAGEALKCPQNLVVANKVDNKEYMEKQIACILGPDSGCDEVKLGCGEFNLNIRRISYHVIMLSRFIILLAYSRISTL